MNENPTEKEIAEYREQAMKDPDKVCTFVCETCEYGLRTKEENPTCPTDWCPKTDMRLDMPIIRRPKSN